MQLCTCEICNKSVAEGGTACEMQTPAPAPQPCYVVLSVGDLRRMLAYAEREAKRWNYPPKTADACCVAFDSTVRPDSKGLLQINSHDLTRASR